MEVHPVLDWMPVTRIFLPPFLPPMATKRYPVRAINVVIAKHVKAMLVCPRSSPRRVIVAKLVELTLIVEMVSVCPSTKCFVVSSLAPEKDAVRTLMIANTSAV